MPLKISDGPELIYCLSTPILAAVIAHPHLLPSEGSAAHFQRLLLFLPIAFSSSFVLDSSSLVLDLFFPLPPIHATSLLVTALVRLISFLLCDIRSSTFLLTSSPTHDHTFPPTLAQHHHYCLPPQPLHVHCPICSDLQSASSVDSLPDCLSLYQPLFPCTLPAPPKEKRKKGPTPRKGNKKKKKIVDEINSTGVMIGSG